MLVTDVKRFPTGSRFIDCCLVFLFGYKPVHLIQHSVNLGHDQQLQCEDKGQ